MKTRNKYLLAEATVTQPVGGAAPSFYIEPEYSVKKTKQDDYVINPYASFTHLNWSVQRLLQFNLTAGFSMLAILERRNSRQLEFTSAMHLAT